MATFGSFAGMATAGVGALCIDECKALDRFDFCNRSPVPSSSSPSSYSHDSSPPLQQGIRQDVGVVRRLMQKAYSHSDLLALTYSP